MYTKGSSACFKFLFFFKIIFFLCVTLVFFSIYVISLVFFWETKKTYLCSIFIDVHLHIRICYHIILFSIVRLT